MYCPTCTTVPLAPVERQGIEIDYCPSCRGVWLDRGELDELIGRANRAYGLSDARGGDEDDDRHRLFAGLGRTRGRRESMLGDLLDFN